MKKAIIALNWILFIVGIVSLLMFICAVIYWMMNLAGAADAAGWLLGYVGTTFLLACGGIGWVALYAYNQGGKDEVHGN